jgi:hypothetical protein
VFATVFAGWRALTLSEVAPAQEPTLGARSKISKVTSKR